MVIYQSCVNNLWIKKIQLYNLSIVSFEHFPRFFSHLSINDIPFPFYHKSVMFYSIIFNVIDYFNTLNILEADVPSLQFSSNDECESIYFSFIMSGVSIIAINIF